MPILSQLQRGATRPRRALRSGVATVEMLEARTLLSSAAVIEWSMAPRIMQDQDHGNAPDLPNTSAYANPTNGYKVLLSALHSVGIVSKTRFSWTVTSPPSKQTTYLVGVAPSIDLPQATYQVELTATGLSGNNGPVSTTTSIQVKDVLIVSIGDSYASGEGNPVVPGTFFPEWAYSPDEAMNVENADAHRSTLAAPAQFALRLQESNPHEAVTFVSVADSGATIPDGVLGPMTSVGDSNYELPAQITELKQIIGSQPINVLTVSIGGNDVQFSTLIKDLIQNDYLGYPSLATIQQDFNSDLSQLPEHYAALATAIKSLDPGQVLVTEYPDLTRNQKGNVVEIPHLISEAGAKLASTEILPALNDEIAIAANLYSWTLVTGFLTNFLTHGYPSTDPWIVSLTQSLKREGSVSGAFHPSAAGQLDIARYLLASYKADLLNSNL